MFSTFSFKSNNGIVRFESAFKTEKNINFLISANFAAVKPMNDGSFCLPLLGTGAKKGLSVSINNFSRGINLKVSDYQQKIVAVRSF